MYALVGIRNKFYWRCVVLSKRVGILCIVLAVFLIGFSLIYFYRNDKLKGVKDNISEPHTNISELSTDIPYDISLVESPNFSLRTEMYKNNLSIFIKSSKKYTSFWVEYKCYGESDELVHEFSNFVSNVDISDEVSYDFIVDASKVKKVVVKVNDAVYDDKIDFFDKDKIKFVVDEVYNDKGVTVNLNANNPFNKKINFIEGYLRFYCDNKLLMATPFKVENVSATGNISSVINIENVDVYDNIEVLINTLF